MDLSWQPWLAGLQVWHDAMDTSILSGTLPDQAALFGVLLKLDRLGLTLLALESSETLTERETERIGESSFGDGKIQNPK